MADEIRISITESEFSAMRSIVTKYLGAENTNVQSPDGLPVTSLVKNGKRGLPDLVNKEVYVTADDGKSYRVSTLGTARGLKNRKVYLLGNPGHERTDKPEKDLTCKICEMNFYHPVTLKDGIRRCYMKFEVPKKEGRDSKDLPIHLATREIADDLWQFIDAGGTLEQAIEILKAH